VDRWEARHTLSSYAFAKPVSGKVKLIGPPFSKASIARLRPFLASRSDRCRLCNPPCNHFGQADDIWRSHRLRSAAFRCGVAFQAGTSPKKDCMSLFIRKEDQHSEDRLLANAWPKLYPLERAGSKPSIGQTRERSRANLTANKLIADTRLPLDWCAQRAVLGFA
jgi:hypothetical protein